MGATVIFLVGENNVHATAKMLGLQQDVCIPSSGYNNDYKYERQRSLLTVGVYNSSIWMHLVSSKCVLC